MCLFDFQNIGPLEPRYIRIYGRICPIVINALLWWLSYFRCCTGSVQHLYYQWFPCVYCGFVDGFWLVEIMLASCLIWPSRYCLIHYYKRFKLRLLLQYSTYSKSRDFLGAVHEVSNTSPNSIFRVCEFVNGFWLINIILASCLTRPSSHCLMHFYKRLKLELL